MFAARPTLPALAAALLLSQAAPATAQCRFELTLFGGLATFLGKEPTGTSFGIPDRPGFAASPAGPEPYLATSYALGLAARLRTGARLAFETSAVLMPTEVCHRECAGDVNLFIWGVVASGILYFPREGSGPEPFVTLGGGVKVYDSDEVVTYPAWSLGGGIALPLVRGAELRLEARDYLSVTDVADFHPRARPKLRDRRLQNDVTLTVGLSVYPAGGVRAGRAPRLLARPAREP